MRNDAKSFLERPVGREKRHGWEEECFHENDCDWEDPIGVNIPTPIVCFFPLLYHGMKKTNVHIFFFPGVNATFIQNG